MGYKDIFIKYQNAIGVLIRPSKRKRVIKNVFTKTEKISI
jgi:hypothetical protein